MSDAPEHSLQMLFEATWPENDPRPTCYGITRKEWLERVIKSDILAAKLAKVTAERDYDRRQSDHKSNVIDRLNRTGQECIDAWKLRAESAEAALKTARRDALEEVLDPQLIASVLRKVHPHNSVSANLMLAHEIVRALIDKEETRP